MTLTDGGFTETTPTACYCDGSRDELAAQVSSADTEILTTGPNTQVNGVGSGSTDVIVQFHTVVLGGVNCYGYEDTSNCQSGAPINQTPAEVTPVILGISPAAILAGTSVGVTISGAGFGANPTVNLPAGFSLSNVSASDSEITGTLAVAVSASLGDNGFSVAADGETSTPATVIADYPVEMEVLGDDTRYCQYCTVTVARFVTYQIRTFAGLPAASISIGESASASDWTCTNPATLGTTACGFTVDPSGEFTDMWSLGTDAAIPPGCGFNIVDQWLWCALTPPQAFGTLSGFVHQQAIEINGVVSPAQLPVGTIIKP